MPRSTWCAVSRAYIVVALCVVVGGQLASAKEFNVNSTLDNDDWLPGDGYCSLSEPILVVPRVCTLRAAIREANAFNDGGPDVINLSAGTYPRTRSGGEEDLSAVGDFDVNAPLTIRGDGADSTIIDAQGLDRVFEVHGTDLTLEDLTLTRGFAFLDGSAAAWGGGVLVRARGFLRLQRCRISQNGGEWTGGALRGFDAREIQILDSDIVDNFNQVRVANFLDAAISVIGRDGHPVRLEVLGSTIRGTYCAGPGSCLGGGLSVGSCTTSTGSGLLMRNSTISGNDGRGLMVESGCNAGIENSTIIDNGWSGVWIGTGAGGESIIARNTVIANNGDQDCDLAVPAATEAWDSDQENNLSSDASCELDAANRDFENTDPQLHPLGHHPPPPPFIAPTHSPRWGSIVVDHGQILPAVADDQYDRPRDVDGNQDLVDGQDIGAIEVMPCEVDPDLVVDADIHTATSSIWKEACRSIATSGPVQISSGNGFEVRFLARDFIVLSSGLSVTADTRFSVALVPYAGAMSLPGPEGAAH